MFWFDSVMHIKRYFKVSYLTVLHRLIENRLADNGIYQQFTLECGKRGISLKDHYEPDAMEPEELKSSDFVAEKLGRLVREAYTREIISAGKAAEILGQPLSRMHDLIQSWSY
jgi:hypothetical protein